jgi:hypothetical protein
MTANSKLGVSTDLANFLPDAIAGMEPGLLIGLARASVSCLPNDSIRHETRGVGIILRLCRRGFQVLGHQ